MTQKEMIKLQVINKALEGALTVKETAVKTWGHFICLVCLGKIYSTEVRLDTIVSKLKNLTLMIFNLLSVQI